MASSFHRIAIAVIVGVASALCVLAVAHAASLGPGHTTTARQPVAARPVPAVVHARALARQAHLRLVAAQRALARALGAQQAAGVTSTSVALPVGRRFVSAAPRPTAATTTGRGSRAGHEHDSGGD
jgi:hypothetical protein